MITDITENNTVEDSIMEISIMEACMIQHSVLNLVHTYVERMWYRTLQKSIVQHFIPY